MEFSDSSSDDEDYHPGHDTEASQTSDDDMTDRLSDITADARSPRVLTTPKPELNNSLQVIDEGKIMVGAVSTPITKDDLIASRTRSRCPMEDVAVEDLEALFNPPDFEPTSFVPEDLDADELIWQGLNFSKDPFFCLLFNRIPLSLYKSWLQNSFVNNGIPIRFH